MASDELVRSVSGKRIRLSGERWRHIEARHAELRGWKGRVLETCSAPDLVVSGREGELLALRSYRNSGKDMFLVVYRERDTDGFIITAILTSNIARLKRREIDGKSPDSF